MALVLPPPTDVATCLRLFLSKYCCRYCGGKQSTRSCCNGCPYLNLCDAASHSLSHSLSRTSHANTCAALQRSYTHSHRSCHTYLSIHTRTPVYGLAIGLFILFYDALCSWIFVFCLLLFVFCFWGLCIQSTRLFSCTGASAVAQRRGFHA